MNIPKYGIVRWRDAMGDKSKKKLNLTDVTRKLPIQETIGWLFSDPQGTIVAVQERSLDKDGVLRRHAEYTLIPASWVIEVLELVLVPKPETTNG